MAINDSILRMQDGVVHNGVSYSQRYQKSFYFWELINIMYDSNKLDAGLCTRACGPQLMY